MKEIIGDAVLYLGDCKDVLPTLPMADAVVTDPPYGIGEAAGKNKSRNHVAQANLRWASMRRYTRDYGNDAWDSLPVSEETRALVIASGKHVIWFGGNYYAFPPSSCWLVWDKENGASDFADCELAWTNLPKAVRLFRFMWNGMFRAAGEGRGDHPTQKPVRVMQWAIGQLPDDAMTILDPFMGSGTTGVACANLGRRFIGIEREEKYFNIACERIDAAYAQGRLF